MVQVREKTGRFVAWPVVFLAMRSWLNDYPYRIKIVAKVFIISGLATLAIAVMMVIYQAVKSAVAVLPLRPG
jgi:putative ABC transport system permease protein